MNRRPRTGWSISEAVLQHIRRLATQATARGDGPAFTAALKELDRLLRLYPQFGDPLRDLEVGGGQLRLGIIRPISMRYGVNEDLRIVFCGMLPGLLPMAKPDTPANEYKGTKRQRAIVAPGSEEGESQLPHRRLTSASENVGQLVTRS